MEALVDSSVAATPRSAAKPDAFELKGVMTSLAVLRMCSLDLSLIERQLRIKIAHLPQFFQDAPVVLDLGALALGGAEVTFAPLVRLLRQCHLVPVAITNASDAGRANAVAEGLGVMPYRATRNASRAGVTMPRGEGAPEQSPGEITRVVRAPARAAEDARTPVRAIADDMPTPMPTPVAAPPPAPRVVRGARPAMVVRQPVRSGQVIYAEQSDLIVLGSVNPGGEVIADGNVHLYGTARGRVIAGAQGYPDAQIFCQRLEAEL
ncbi:MAG TPA: septum site-determining protein MinC, partial [Burkholderiaceae bacterium]|nr:septum site-determining protein MinC [Burkholderiaceae bacterium]